MRLVKLKASSVRGIPNDWPELPIKEKGLILCGPNGVGKSSILDAIEFGLTGRSSLFSENRQGVSWETASPHVLHGEPKICLFIKDGQDTLEINDGPLPGAISGQAKAWLETAKKSSFVLRRHMLLKFITEKPADRYGLLEPFFNMESFVPIEDALQALVASHTAKKLQTQAKVDNFDVQLRTLFNVPLTTLLVEVTLTAHLNATLAKLGLGPCSDAASLAERMQQVNALLGDKDKGNRLASLGSLKTRILQLGSAATLRPLLDNLFAELTHLEKDLARKTDQVSAEFLETGAGIIEGGNLGECPLCEKPIADRPALLERIKLRIAADATITAAKKRVRDAQEPLAKDASELHGAMVQFAKDRKTTLGTAVPAAYDETLAVLAALLKELRTKDLTTAQFLSFPTLLTSAITDHSAELQVVDALIMTEGGGEKRKLLTDASSMTAAILTILPKRNEALTARDAETKKIATIERLHAHAVTARKETVKVVLEDVSKVANEFYERIHPGEGIATSKLSIRAMAQKSVDMEATFHGKDAPPLRYLSESHLDTLGICYFLALRKYETSRTPKFRLLVLDDVMHSIDADHRNRVAQLLKEQFKDFQLLITTHDPHFYDMLRLHLGSGGYEYCRVVNWSVTTGPVLIDPLTDLDRITNGAVRQAMAHDNLAAAGGRFFEWLLREITENLKISLEARFRRGHDIGSMWPKTKSILDKHKGFKQSHSDLTEQLHANNWVRNACGAHYNPTSAPPSPREVQDFGAHLAALFAAVFCQECGEFLREQQDKSWRCSCAKLGYPS
jgi:hypothetical protein